MSEANRHEAIDEPRTVKVWTHFNFPGRQGQYSEMEWHWWHFTAIDYDDNNPDYEAVYLFEGKQFDENVDLEKRRF